MGDMADANIEEGMDQWYDHLAGHPQFPSDYCQYCEDDMYSDDKENHEKRDS